MSYTLSAGLQSAVYNRLTNDPGIATLIGSAVFDAPLENVPDISEAEYVTIGEETVRSNDTITSRGSVHDFDVSVISGRDGFERAKQIAGAVCDALVDADLQVGGGDLVALRFLRARAVRGPAPVKRKITLRFRAVVDEL